MSSAKVVKLLDNDAREVKVEGARGIDEVKFRTDEVCSGLVESWEGSVTMVVVGSQSKRKGEGTGGR